MNNVNRIDSGSSNRISVGIAKFIMKIFASYPISPEVEISDLQEIFDHPIFSQCD
jgi:hypothetical protein